MVLLIAYFITWIRYRQGKHLIDVTEIFNLLSWEKKQRLVKLFYLVLTLFLSVFWYSDFKKALLSVIFMVFIKIEVILKRSFLLQDDIHIIGVTMTNNWC